MMIAWNMYSYLFVQITDLDMLILTSCFSQFCSLQRIRATLQGRDSFAFCNNIFHPNIIRTCNFKYLQNDPNARGPLR